MTTTETPARAAVHAMSPAAVTSGVAEYHRVVARARRIAAALDALRAVERYDLDALPEDARAAVCDAASLLAPELDALDALIASADEAA